MTTRFKDFGTGTPVDEQPLSFALHGETFNCRPALQGKFLLDLVAQSNDDDPAAAAELVNKFFANVLDPESFERFESLVQDPDRIVSVETLGEITGWLVSEYTDRPTQQPEISSNGE